MEQETEAGSMTPQFRAMRRKAHDMQVAREVSDYYGDGEKVLDRVSVYLAHEFGRAENAGDRVRCAGIRGAVSVLNAARQRVLTESIDCPF